jgi:hypothetical protein
MCKYYGIGLATFNNMYSSFLRILIYNTRCKKKYHTPQIKNCIYIIRIISELTNINAFLELRVWSLRKSEAFQSIATNRAAQLLTVRLLTQSQKWHAIHKKEQSSAILLVDGLFKRQYEEGKRSVHGWSRKIEQLFLAMSGQKRNASFEDVSSWSNRGNGNAYDGGGRVIENGGRSRSSGRGDDNEDAEEARGSEHESHDGSSDEGAPNGPPDVNSEDDGESSDFAAQQDHRSAAPQGAPTVAQPLFLMLLIAVDDKKPIHSFFEVMNPDFGKGGLEQGNFKRFILQRYHFLDGNHKDSQNVNTPKSEMLEDHMEIEGEASRTEITGSQQQGQPGTNAGNNDDDATVNEESIVLS